MAFIATSDAHGECDSSFRAGPAGFMRVIDEKTVMWPEYKGNGVMASMGNISENPYVGLLMVDFFETAVGLHVNGKATIVDNEAIAAFAPLFDRLPFATAMPSSPDEIEEDPRALGRGHDRRGLHPLLQAHPDAAAAPRSRPRPVAAPVTCSRPRTSTEHGWARRGLRDPGRARDRSRSRSLASPSRPGRRRTHRRAVACRCLSVK